MKKDGRAASFGKKLVACGCSLAIGFALVPAMAFAADGTSTGSSSSTTESTVIQVKIKDAQTGAETTLKSGAFTQSKLDALAAQNTTSQYYTYAGKGGATVVSTTKYVTIEQLISACGLGEEAWNEQSTVTFGAADGASKASPTYQEVTQDQYYYPEGTSSGPQGTGTKVSAAIGFNEASASVAGDSTNADVAKTFTEASYTTTNNPRSYFGTAAGATSYTAGNHFWSNITTVTINYPHPEFKVIERNAETGAETTVGSYSDEALANLAKANTTTQSYLYAVKGGTVYSTNNYVTLEQLVANDKNWKTGSSIEVNTPDNFTATFTYEDLQTNTSFFGNYDLAGKDMTSTATVPPVVALSYTSTALANTSTAGDIAKQFDATKATTENRWFSGNSASEVSMGRMSPTNVSKITIIYTPEKTTPAKGISTGKSATAGSGATKATYKVTSSKASTVTYTASKAKSSAKSVTVPATVKVNGKTYKVTAVAKGAFKGKKATKVTLGKNVKTVAKGAFKGSKVKTVVLKTTRLTKKSVKGSLKGSKVTTVKVSVGKAKANKKYVKAYKKIFTKANAGKKATVKR